jgi:hypothetical protein
VDAPPGLVGGADQAAVAADEAGRALVAEHTTGLGTQDQLLVVRSSCHINDAYGILTADDLVDASEQVLASAGGSSTLTLRVAGLASDLIEAETSGEQFQQLVVAAAREVA